MSVRLRELIGPALFAAALAIPAVAAAQAPPDPKAPPTSSKEVHDPKACADERATVGKGGTLDATPDNRNLSDKLAQSSGVICPPDHVDPEIKAPTPDAGRMRVIPPPGTPDGDQKVEPK